MQKTNRLEKFNFLFQWWKALFLSNQTQIEASYFSPPNSLFNHFEHLSSYLKTYKAVIFVFA